MVSIWDALALTLVTAAGGQVEGQQSNGFVCVAPDGAERRLNIDLGRGTFNEGDHDNQFSRVTETEVVLSDISASRYEIGTPSESYFTERLDRSSLVLTSSMYWPYTGVRQTKSFRCEIGAAIDFTKGRKF